MDLNESHKRILMSLDDSEPLSYEEIAEKTGVSYNGVRGRVSELVSMGFNIDRFRVGNKTMVNYTSDDEEVDTKMPISYSSVLSSRTKSLDDYLKITALLSKLKKFDKKVEKKSLSKVDGRYVLFLSDLHLGQKITLDGKIHYDTKIAKQRILDLTIKVLKELDSNNAKNLVVLLGGDIVDGDAIYKNHIFHVDIPAITQVKEATEALHNMFVMFNNNNVELDVYCVRGNHGIVNYNNVEVDNWDNVVYDMLELAFKDDYMTRIYHGREDSMLIDFGDRKGVLMHGNEMSSQISTPSGVSSFRGLCSRYYLDRGDLVFVGHLHTFGVETDHDRVLVRNGSLSDTNDYALRKKFFSSPSQTLLYLKEDNAYPDIMPIGVE